ncbi:MAG: M23 family metallopeptidase [Ruminococcaceae bacterium]|nr:M23 family metallopeptidase [Oscillospiraceae bacterium]
MKQTKQAQKKQRFSPASYIGVGIVAIVGLAGLFSSLRVMQVTEQITNQTELPIQSNLPVFSPTQEPAEATPPAKIEKQIEKASAQQAEKAVKKEPFTVMMPCPGTVAVPFSKDALLFSKTMGDWRVHEGLDIKAETGEEVKACADGVVTKTFKDPLMGHTIILQHEGDYQSLYQNLASTEMVHEGDRVEKGQCIGAVGDSAAAEMLEEAHVHFAILQGDGFLNPMDFLKQE